MISRLLRNVSNRRAFLGAGAMLPLAPLVAGAAEPIGVQHVAAHTRTHAGSMTTVGTVDHARNGFDQCLPFKHLLYRVMQAHRHICIGVTFDAEGIRLTHKIERHILTYYMRIVARGTCHAELRGFDGNRVRRVTFAVTFVKPWGDPPLSLYFTVAPFFEVLHFVPASACASWTRTRAS